MAFRRNFRRNFRQNREIDLDQAANYLKDLVSKVKAKNVDQQNLVNGLEMKEEDDLW